MTLQPDLGRVLRALYGDEAVDRLEAAPDDGTANLGDQMTALAELSYEPDEAERERFAAACERELRGDLDE